MLWNLDEPLLNKISVVIVEFYHTTKFMQHNLIYFLMCLIKRLITNRQIASNPSAVIFGQSRL